MFSILYIEIYYQGYISFKITKKLVHRMLFDEGIIYNNRSHKKRTQDVSILRVITYK